MRRLKENEKIKKYLKKQQKQQKQQTAFSQKEICTKMKKIKNSK